MNLTINRTCDKLSNALCYTTDFTNKDKCQPSEDNSENQAATRQENTRWINLAEQVSSVNNTGFEFEISVTAGPKSYTHNTTVSTFNFSGDTTDLGFNTLGLKGGFGLFE